VEQSFLQNAVGEKKNDQGDAIEMRKKTIYKKANLQK
jgi:hypothetical protein